MQLLAGEANEFARDSVALLSSARTSLKVGLLCNAACLDAFACRLRRYKCVGSLSGTMCSRDDYTCVRKTQNGAFAQGQAERRVLSRGADVPGSVSSRNTTSGSWGRHLSGTACAGW